MIPGAIERRSRERSAGFLDPAAADAGSADLHGSGGAVIVDVHGLDVGFEGPGGNFDHVHTDTAFFLGKTSADDSRTLNFFLSANFADITHFTPLKYVDIYVPNQCQVI